MKTFKCNECNLSLMGDDLNYCPRCGQNYENVGSRFKQRLSDSYMKEQEHKAEALLKESRMKGVTAGDINMSNKRIEELPMADKCECLGNWPINDSGLCIKCGLYRNPPQFKSCPDHNGNTIRDQVKGAMRFNKNKPDFTQIDFASLLPMVNTLMFGEVKYARANWRQGGDNMSKVELLKSLSRHVNDLIDAVNEDNFKAEFDPETAEHLIGNILCNGMFYAYHHVPKNKTYNAAEQYKKYLEDKEWRAKVKESAETMAKDFKDM